ncbi:MAG: aldo/keto reductase [Planctomycetota bacterium]|nr:MAG: aldo/keto reductase [Planctomycetota bacterium]
MSERVITRRRFLHSSATLAGSLLLSATVLEAAPPKRIPTAVDQVKLGKTGLKLSRLGIGTGSIGGSIQRALGQEEFTKLIRYGYDQGITYIDTAEAYRTHEMVREAIKPLPREKLFIQTKMSGRVEKPLETIDRYRKELGVDYIDSLLTHCAVAENWDQERKRFLDAFEEAKQKGIIRAHGVSCHSLPALTKAAQMKWCDVHLVRINPQGVCIDTPAKKWNTKSDKSHIAPVMEQIGIMKKNKHGIIGMKLIGNGNFKNLADRKKSIEFAMQCGLLDAAVIGFKNTAEIDEAIKLMNAALKETV